MSVGGSERERVIDHVVKCSCLCVGEGVSEMIVREHLRRQVKKRERMREFEGPRDKWRWRTNCLNNFRISIYFLKLVSKFQ